MEYQEIRVTKCSDSKALYHRVIRIRGSVAVTDLGKIVYVYGYMTKDEFDAIIRVCVQFGEVDT